MPNSYFNSYSSPEAMFDQALHLARQGQCQPAYHLFKQLSNTPFGANNPAVWLWLVHLTTDFKEGEAALQKLAELDPAHRDLDPAKLDFAQRKHNTLLKRRIGSVGMLVSLAFALFFISQTAEFFPAVGNLPGIYTRQYMYKIVAVMGSWVAIFFYLSFMVYFLTGRVLRHQWQLLLFLLSVGGLLLLNLVIIFSHLGRAEEYHNQVQVNGSVYHLESVRFNRGGGHSEPYRIVRVFKCDPTGLLCSTHFTTKYEIEADYDGYYKSHKTSDFRLSRSVGGGLEVLYKNGQLIKVPL
jgi:hypothetical protein